MEILLFGITRDIVGKQTLTVTDDHDIATVGDLKLWLSRQYPAIAQLSSLAVAVNNEYADNYIELNEASEIALIPPVSGG